ncbi:MAG: glutamine-synthetase adenylyltransferase, partial [Pyrinomonadaceae bacterium]
MPKIDQLIRGLPDPEAARRFLDQLAEKHPAQAAKLHKKEALLSDAATLASFSPLLTTTMLQHPDYLWWLERKRRDSGVRSVDDLVESLAQFALTNSTLEPQVLYARFRRRELLRIYLRDIRRLATIAEITEEISNLADAILESALKQARSEMDKRYGLPQETDAKGRAVTARFCIAALGKLGSRELNYSSDIDLLFL